MPLPLVPVVATAVAESPAIIQVIGAFGGLMAYETYNSQYYDYHGASAFDYGSSYYGRYVPNVTAQMEEYIFSVPLVTSAYQISFASSLAVLIDKIFSIPSFAPFVAHDWGKVVNEGFSGLGLPDIPDTAINNPSYTPQGVPKNPTGTILGGIGLLLDRGIVVAPEIENGVRGIGAEVIAKALPQIKTALNEALATAQADYAYYLPRVVKGIELGITPYYDPDRWPALKANIDATNIAKSKIVEIVEFFGNLIDDLLEDKLKNCQDCDSAWSALSPYYMGNGVDNGTFKSICQDKRNQLAQNEPCCLKRLCCYGYKG